MAALTGAAGEARSLRDLLLENIDATLAGGSGTDGVASANVMPRGLLGYDRAAGDWNRLDTAGGDGLSGDNVPASGLMLHAGSGSWNRAATVNSLGDGVSASGLQGMASWAYDRTASNYNRITMASQDGLSGDNILASGNMIYNPGDTNWTRMSSSSRDGETDHKVLMAGMAGFNDTVDTSIDRWRNNVEGTAMGSAPRVAETTSADITNYNSRTLHVWQNITAVPGSGSVTMSVQTKDPVSGVYTSIGSDSSQTATGMRYFIYSTGNADATIAQVSKSFGHAPSRTFRIKITVASGASYTYSVGYALVV